MRIVILGNGEWKNTSDFLRQITPTDLIVACDGAYAKGKRLGLSPHVLMGDFDSLKKIPKVSNLEILSFPQDKDATDGELAFKYALARRPNKIVWYSAFGGRLDHTFANLFLLLQAVPKRIPVTLMQGQWDVHLVFEKIGLRGTKGDRVSLIPLSPKVSGITTKSLKFSLQEGVLFQRESRGVSNVLSAAAGEVRLKKGSLLVLHEKALQKESLRKSVRR